MKREIKKTKLTREAIRPLLLSTVLGGNNGGIPISKGADTEPGRGCNQN
jgi:hypothetical protein